MRSRLRWLMLIVVIVMVVLSA
ncbi:MAG: hypothetical protein RI912_1417, partial [Actinomycetota bacterium]